MVGSIWLNTQTGAQDYQANVQLLNNNSNNVKQTLNENAALYSVSTNSTIAICVEDK